MTHRITRMISIGRDTIMQYGQQAAFFNAAPGLAFLKDKFTECRTAFDKSAKERGCSCRADTNTLAPCIQAFVAALDAAKAGDQETIRQFIQFVAKTPNIETTGVTIYFAPTNGGAPEMHTYP